MFKLYEKANNNYPYIRYVMLSGNDYPLKSNQAIYDTLQEQSVEFITGSPNTHPEKIENFYFKKSGFTGKCATHALAILHIKRNRKPFIIDNKYYAIYFSPQWHALTGACVLEILNIYRANKKYIDHYWKYTFASDELLIPTIVFNSQFKDHALRSSFPKGTHYNEMPAIHFIDYEPIVRVFTEQDEEDLFKSGKLFARKVKSGTSEKLITDINKLTGRNDY